MAAPNVSIREHRIPTRGAARISASKGRIAACGSAKAAPGRSAASIRTGAFRNSRCPIPRRRRSASPSAATAISGSAQKAANKIGRITLAGDIAEFPTADAEGRTRRHDPRSRRQCLVLRNRSQPHRPHHAGRRDHRIFRGHLAGRAATVDRGARRRALVQRSLRQPHRPHHHRRRGDRVSDPEPRQPAARHGHASGRLDLVRARPAPIRSAASTATARSPSIR